MICAFLKSFVRGNNLWRKTSTHSMMKTAHSAPASFGAIKWKFDCAESKKNAPHSEKHSRISSINVYLASLSSRKRNNSPARRVCVCARAIQNTNNVGLICCNWVVCDIKSSEPRAGRERGAQA
jgi:hypothetical protein